MLQLLGLHASVATFARAKNLNPSNTQVRSEAENAAIRELEQRASDIYASNNYSFVNKLNYMSVFRNREIPTDYYYTVHDNENNIVASETRSTVETVSHALSGWERVLGGPDYADQLQFAADFASFLTGVV